MSVWDEKWGAVSRPQIDFTTRTLFAQIKAQVPFRGRSLVELGCGSGRLSYLALQEGATRATLVDNSEEALNLSKQLLQDYPRAQFVRADVRQDLPPLQADLVLSSGLIEHFKGKELDIVLKNHSKAALEKVILIVPASPHYNNLRMRFQKCRDEFGWQRPFSRKKLCAALEQNQLKLLFLKRFFVTYGMHGLPGRTQLEKSLRPFESFLGGLFLAITVPEVRQHSP